MNRDYFPPAPMTDNSQPYDSPSISSSSYFNSPSIESPSPYFNPPALSAYTSMSPNLNSANPFMRVKSQMIFDPLDELLRGSNDLQKTTIDSKQRALVAKQRRERLTVTFDKLRDLLIPFGIDSNSGRTKLLDYATDLISQIAEDPSFHNYRSQ